MENQEQEKQPLKFTTMYKRQSNFPLNKHILHMFIMYYYRATSLHCNYFTDMSLYLTVCLLKQKQEKKQHKNIFSQISIDISIRPNKNELF